MHIDTASPILAFNLALFLTNFILLHLIIKNLIKMKSAKKELDQPPVETLVLAQTQANKVLEEATQKAKALISNTNIVSDNLEGQLSKLLNNLVSNSSAEVSKVLIEIKSQNKNLIDELNKTSDKAVAELVDGLKNTGDQEVKEAFSGFREKFNTMNEDMLNKLNTKYENSLQEIEAYKKQRIKDIDTEVVETVKSIATKALPQSLSYEVQEELLLKAIKEAKEEGVFVRDH